LLAEHDNVLRQIFKERIWDKLPTSRYRFYKDHNVDPGNFYNWVTHGKQSRKCRQAALLALFSQEAQHTSQSVSLSEFANRMFGREDGKCVVCHDEVHSDMKNVIRPMCCQEKNPVHVRCLKEWWEFENQSRFGVCPVCNSDVPHSSEIAQNLGFGDVTLTKEMMDYGEYNDLVNAAATVYDKLTASSRENHMWLHCGLFYVMAGYASATTQLLCKHDFAHLKVDNVECIGSPCIQLLLESGQLANRESDSDQNVVVGMLCDTLISILPSTIEQMLLLVESSSWSKKFDLCESPTSFFDSKWIELASDTIAESWGPPPSLEEMELLEPKLRWGEPVKAFYPLPSKLVAPKENWEPVKRPNYSPFVVQQSTPLWD
jgi:hypothetical protein